MMLSSLRLREIAWEVGQHYPTRLSVDYIALAMVNPYLGQVHWHVKKKNRSKQLGLRRAIAPSWFAFTMSPISCSTA